MTAAERKHRNHKRRAAVRHALFTRGPVRLTRGRFNRPRPGRDFVINERTVDLPHLPDELCGLAIAHMSDPHIGELITPDHLPPMIDAINSLGADLIAVTGDFIDYSNAFLPEVIDAMKQLDAPLGAYFVLGNHDYLDNADVVKAAFAQARLNLMLNSTVTLEHRHKKISLAGIDWTDAQRTMIRSIRNTHRAMNPSDVSILLAHHPHAFDIAHRCGIDLTLAGHTHGGQFLLSTKRGKKGSIGLANIGFRYTRGLYARGDSRLFVSSGVGSWFPFRFRCPAEITRIELQNPY